jgi:hypothetical protein
MYASDIPCSALYVERSQCWLQYILADPSVIDQLIKIVYSSVDKKLIEVLKVHSLKKTVFNFVGGRKPLKP